MCIKYLCSFEGPDAMQAVELHKQSVGVLLDMLTVAWQQLKQQLHLPLHMHNILPRWIRYSCSTVAAKYRQAQIW